MAEQIGEILVRIRADMKQLEDALNKSGTQVKSFSDKMASAAKTMTGIGMKMSLAVTAPLALIGKKAVDAAMDVVESENLFEVSMGNMADQARAFSEEFARSVGLNEYSVRKNIGTFNVMFDAMGMGTAKSYELAQGLTTLAYDMASFYNLDVEDAFQKLQAGITGEIEPLKRLGIVVNETAVQQWAWNNGLVDQGEKLTEQEKILGRYGAIMDATAKAQGDLAMTLDSPANKMRIFKEQISLAMIELGESFIPVVMDVIDIIKPFVEKFKDLNDQQKDWIAKAIIIAAATGPIVLATGQIMKMATGVVALKDAIVALSIAEKSSFIFGGGAIAAGAVWALLQTGDSIDVLADKSDEAKEAIEGMSATIKEVSGNLSAGKNAQDDFAFSLTALYREIEKHPSLYEEVNTKLKEINKSYEEGTIGWYAARTAVSELANEYEDYGATMAGYDKYMAEASKSTAKTTDAIEDLGEAVEETEQSIEDLLDSLFRLYNLNQSATETGWAYEDALKAQEEAIRKYGEGSREAEEAIFKTQDSLEDYINAIWEEYSAEETSLARKLELKKAYEELGEKAVESGQMSKKSFDEMHKKFEETTNGIIGLATRINGAIGGIKGKNVDINVRVKYTKEGDIPNYAPGMPDMPKGKQSGGEVGSTGYIPDLNIIGIKGEGILTREIMNAIKTGREDYLGVNGRSSGSGSMVNHFNFYGMVVREEADLDRFASVVSNRLYNDSETKKRLGG